MFPKKGVNNWNDITSTSEPRLVRGIIPKWIQMDMFQVGDVFFFFTQIYVCNINHVMQCGR